MPRSELINVAMAAALMNIGYLALRRSLLDQPRRLLEGEWEEHIHTHPGRGTKLLERSGLADSCLQAIAQHHERWDGTGYPTGLRGDAISRHARIIAVADSYVSLRSIRPHRPPVDAEVALEEVAAGRDKMFDPDVVDAFEDVIGRFSGITRRARDASVATSAAAVGDDAHATAQRDAGDACGTDATTDSTDEANAEDEQPGSRGRRRRAVRSPVYDDGEQVDRKGTPATLPPLNEPVKQIRIAPPLPAARFEAAPSSTMAVTPARSRRRRTRRIRRRHLLFAARCYVNAALLGRWSSDSLKR